MTRDELLMIYKSAKLIYTESRLASVRRNARAICAKIEEHAGQIGSTPASEWEV